MVDQVNFWSTSISLLVNLYPSVNWEHEVRRRVNLESKVNDSKVNLISKQFNIDLLESSNLISSLSKDFQFLF